MHCHICILSVYFTIIINFKQKFVISIFFFKWLTSGHLVDTQRLLSIVTHYRQSIVIINKDPFSIVIVYEDLFIDYLYGIAIRFHNRKSILVVIVTLCRNSIILHYRIANRQSINYFNYLCIIYKEPQ
jgi:hypothetical protein